MSPLISVCIPVFNGEKYIRECIASVLCQTEGDFEILICDNCSTDKTLDVCREFVDPRIRILQNDRNIGSMDNFYRCIQNAIGKLFILLPCDDLLEKDCLKLMSNGFVENASVGIAYGSHLQIDHRGEKIGTSVVAHDGVLVSEDAIRTVAEQFNPIQHPMVRLEVLSKVGEFNKSFGCFCDIHLWLKVLFSGWDAYVVSKPITAIRSHKNQGQTLFRQDTEENLRRLSCHYGYILPPDFYKENHFNLLFFRFVGFFSDNLGQGVMGPNKLLRVMIVRLVRSHLSNFFLSLRTRNTASCRMEMSLSADLIKRYGFTQMLTAYFSAGGSFFRKMLQNSID